MKPKIKSFLNQLKIGFVFFGTMVGAGFASGKETWVYFANFGVIGYVSIFIACLLFLVCGILFLNFGKKYHIISVQQMNEMLFKKFSIIAEIVMGLCNLILLASMLAGANSLFGLFVDSGIFRVASVVTAVVALFVVWFGFRGLTKANIVVVPLLLCVLLGCLFFNFGNFEHYSIAKNFEFFNVFKCFLYCILFVSSNMFFAGFIFSKLGVNHSNKEIVLGCFIGSALLLISLCLMSVVLFLNPQSHQSNMPLVFIAYNLNSAFSIFTFVVVWVGLVSTAIALLYTITNWLKTYLGNVYISSILATVVAMFLSGIGFSGFIVYIYPFLGVLGVVYVCFVCIFVVKKENCKQRRKRKVKATNYRLSKI